jgi:hypothetical protein
MSIAARKMADMGVSGAKREAVAHARQQHGVSERRA